MKRRTDLDYQITRAAIRAVKHGDYAWIQDHRAVTAFLELGAVPRVGKYRHRDLVFYRRRNRQYVWPVNPRTLAQLRVRAIMREVSAAYSQGLTPPQRLAWDLAAAQELSRLRLTQGPLTGQVLFVKLNCVLRLLGREWLVSPPERVVFGPNPVEDLVIRREHGRMRLKLRMVGTVSEDILVYGEAPVSAGRNKPRHPVYLGLLPAARGGWSDITEQYVERFGELEPGKKIIICTRQQRNGWEDFKTSVSGAVVPQRTPRKTRNTRNGMIVGPGFKGLAELLGLAELNGLKELKELKQINEGVVAGWESKWQVRQFEGVTLGRWERIGPCTWECYRRSTIELPSNQACAAGFGQADTDGTGWHGGMSQACVSGGGQAPAGVGKRRKGHWRALWRGT